MVLYCTAQPLPVLSLGLSVPPERIEPVCSVISTFCRQTGCSGSLLPPLQSPPAGGLGPRSLPSTIWSIWPTFSSSVMRPSRSLTRAGTGAFGSRYLGPAAEALWVASRVPVRASTDRRTAATASLFLHLTI